jgi:4-(gamma-glutamylamino)butanal dehydrogenase
VAEHAVTAAFWNMGQNCTCGSRLIVHDSIEDALLDRIVREIDAWPMGDPLDESTRLGPLISRSQYEKVVDFVDSGRAEGADVVCGGEPALSDSRGHYIAPTVFRGVRHDMRIAREEIFGPVIATISFADADEAIRLANDTSYGLAASLWTTDLATALDASRRIRAGTVSVNCYAEGDVTTPFGGYKSSGFGNRDNGVQALDQYTETKTIWIDASRGLR